MKTSAAAHLLSDSPVKGPSFGEAAKTDKGPSAGDVLSDRYQLVRPLGEGGMGSVWKARNLALDVDVAVKVVKRTASSERARLRLLGEARAIARLAHPSIVRVYDFGFTDSGEPFLVMQLLRGQTLGAWLDARGQIPATSAVQILLPIIDALAEVHALGIVHRDIKPDNIIIEEGPTGELIPKLLDFGIAKQVSSQENITQSGVLMGSPAYMSPEQARGERNIEPQSDIWSLCVTLYEMIVGKRPFDGNNPGATLFSVFADTPLPTHAQGAGDEELWTIIRRGLEKSPAERWSSMRELGVALAAWAAARGVTADIAGTSLAHQWLGRNSSSELASIPPRVSQVRVVPASSPRRRSLLGIGGACAVVTSILTFVALAPGEPNVASAASAHAAVVQEVVIAPKSVEMDATVELKAEPRTEVSDASAVLGNTVLIDAVPQSAPTVHIHEAPSSARASNRSRRPGQSRVSLPLPARPDF